MSDEKEIKRLKGKILVLERVCVALAKSLPSATPDRLFDSSAVFFKQLNSIESGIDKSIQDHEFQRGVSDTVLNFKNAFKVSRRR